MAGIVDERCNSSTLLERVPKFNNTQQVVGIENFYPKVLNQLAYPGAKPQCRHHAKSAVTIKAINKPAENLRAGKPDVNS